MKRPKNHPRPKSLLSVSSDAKTVKGEELGYLTGVQYIAPGSASGFNVCQGASEGCLQVCLGLYSGRALFTPSIVEARIARARWIFEDKVGYLAQLDKEIRALERKASRMGLEPVVRLNGSSDLPWERVAPEILERFGHLRFYDYTKVPSRTGLPSNYDLTFSLSESNEAAAKEALLENGIRLAVVFRNELPSTFWGVPVINGDATDLRFLDPQAVVVGLLAKGAAKKDESGFVRESGELIQIGRKVA